MTDAWTLEFPEYTHFRLGDVILSANKHIDRVTMVRVCTVRSPLPSFTSCRLGQLQEHSAPYDEEVWCAIAADATLEANSFNGLPRDLQLQVAKELFNHFFFLHCYNVEFGTEVDIDPCEELFSCSVGAYILPSEAIFSRSLSIFCLPL